MKTLKFNRNSWHYKLASQFTSFYEGDEYDICSYLKKVLGALFIVSLLILLTVSCCFLVGDFLAYILVSIINLTWLAPEVPAIITICSIVLMVGLLIISYVGRISARVGDKIADSFIIESFLSFKGKYFPKIEFVDQNLNKKIDV